ncbi:PAS domain-containing methyl-accepting chemotaxis protein [Acidisoma sp.]|uniref:methyl-accepting chemotaxis protein n=1 Tax=Acidisoma sp. TaxID=1872115 RepID=UPI003B00DEBD
MLSLHRALLPKAKRVLNALDRSLAIIEFNPQGRILAANHEFCQLMGYDAAELLGKHHSIFVDPAYAASAAYKAFWAKLGRGEFDRQEYPRLTKSGRQVWIQASYNPILNGAGKVVSIVKVASDTTAARLRNITFEAKLAAISRVQGMIEFKPTGEIIDANENLLASLGYRLDEVAGKHHRMLVEPAYAASAEYQEFWRKLNAGQFIAGEFRRLGKNGQAVWIQASYNPIFDLNNKVTSILKFATNITGRVQAVAEVAAGMAELAQNNLQFRLSQAFEPAFEPVRADYNTSLACLEMTIARVAASSEMIQARVAEIVASTDDMARCIEEQTEGLQETAAALDEITMTVKQGVEGAFDAALAASGARSGTARSSQVMSLAATVMTEINESSKKITQIIGVMDEIAFQTNLLALNAGVEAARAGDSGRGFAVVAQEVRALAQRSAEAAKEIKSLISSSSEEVKRGVELVNETAGALTGVTEQVARIDALLSQMASAAKQQAIGLVEVNKAVNRMDLEQNAGMIKEASRAAATLKVEAVEMAGLIGQFRIERASRAPSSGARPAAVAHGGQPRSRPRAMALPD